MPQTPEAPRKILRRDFIRGAIGILGAGAVGAIATACGVKPSPEKLTPTPTQEAPTPTSVPSPTPTQEAPTPTPTKEAPTKTPLPEAVRIPEIPEYGVFSGEGTSKEGKIGLLVAHLPGRDPGYLAFFVESSGMGIAYVFRVKKSEPETYSQIEKKRNMSIEIKSGEGFLKAEVTEKLGEQQQELYKLNLQFKGQGKNTVLKTMSDLIFNVARSGPVSNERLERTMLKVYEISLP